MLKLHVERIGGFGGFGGKNSHIRSQGDVDMESLSVTDQRVVNGLFLSHDKPKDSMARDVFHYRISRPTPKGVETIEVPEQMVPTAISQCVKDEFV